MLSLKSTLVLALLPFTVASPLEPPVIGGRFSSQIQNDLSKPCKPVTVIFARGTNEKGNVGKVTGPPFFQALARRLGWDEMAVQGVEYPATKEGIWHNGDPDGSKKMASLVQDAFKKCPKTKVVISGYCQGAMLVHNAAKLLPENVTGNISAAVTFGDPYRKQAIKGVSPDRTKVFCYAYDRFCQKGRFEMTWGHLYYGRWDTGEAADFVASVLHNQTSGL